MLAPSFTLIQGDGTPVQATKSTRAEQALSQNTPSHMHMHALLCFDLCAQQARYRCVAQSRV